MLESLITDVKYALRSFRRAPGFTAAAFLTLVSGIAGITSLFSYTNAAWYADLPYKDAKRTIAVGQTYGLWYPEISAAAIRLVREEATSFEQMAVMDMDFTTIVLGDEPFATQALKIDTAFQGMFGLRPQLGRLLTEAEIAGDAPVALISSALWRTRFGADSSVLGRELKMASGSRTIVGVLPEGWRYPWHTDVVTPLRMNIDPSESEMPDYGLVARLKPGIPHASAQSEIAVLDKRLTSRLLSQNNWRLHANDEMLNRRANQFMPLPQLFLGVGLLVLLIACANVANLFLARGAERSREVAVRASLGASRWRLIRQSLTETLVLGVAAAVAGIAMSGALVKIALSMIPTEGFPSWFNVAVDFRVLAFTAGVTLLVTMATGLMPARVVSKFDLARALKVGGDGATSSKAVVNSSKRGLAVQLALAVSLFASTVLFVRTYFEISKVDLGYPAAAIATVMPHFDQARYPDWEARMTFAEAIAERVMGQPGVAGVAVRAGYGGPRVPRGAKKAPDNERYDGRMIPDGDTTRAVRYRLGLRQYTVSESYFAVLGLKVRAGRAFASSDRHGAPPVVIVSEAAAKMLWPGTNAVGKRVQIGAKGIPAEVIGVVQDVREIAGGRNGRSFPAGQTFYFPTAQSIAPSPEILAIGRGGNPSAARSVIVNEVRNADRQLVLIPRMTTLASGLESAMFETRVFGGLIGTFSLVALCLSLIGIYGVVAFGVSRRTREIGIRIALGGTMHDVLKLIMADALKFVVAGLVVGLVLAVGLGKLVAVLLYGVQATDPLTYGVVCLVFGGVAIAACYMPARRALAVDPLTALRSE